MTLRQRKFVGTFATVAFIVIYCLVAMALGGTYVVGRGGMTEFAFFVIAGFAWLPVVMVLIRWMSRGAAE